VVRGAGDELDDPLPDAKVELDYVHSHPFSIDPRRRIVPDPAVPTGALRNGTRKTPSWAQRGPRLLPLSAG